jgi:hypothetical protein
MEKYIVTLSAPEAEQLQALGAKGTHVAAKVINALIQLNCDESQARGRRRSTQEIAEVLQVSARKIDRVKRRLSLYEAFAPAQASSRRQADSRSCASRGSYIITTGCAGGIMQSLSSMLPRGTFIP